MATFGLGAASRLARRRRLGAPRSGQTTVPAEDRTELAVAQAQILDQLSEAIITVGADHRVTSWNRGAERLFAWPAAAAVGRPAEDVLRWKWLNADAEIEANARARQGLGWRGDLLYRLPDGRDITIEMETQPLPAAASAGPFGYVVVARDVDAHRKGDEEARVRARQHAAVAAVGQRALAGIEVALLMEQTVALVGHTLGVSHAAVFELDAARHELQLRAGVGWAADRSPRMSSVPGTQGAYAISVGRPVVVEDLARDARFTAEPSWCREGLASGAHVVIEGRLRPYGLFVVFNREHRAFSRDDLHFLQSVSNVVGAAIERKQVEEELRVALSLHRATLESTADGILVVDTGGHISSFNHKFLELWELSPSVTASRDQKDLVAAMLQRTKDPVGFTAILLQAEGDPGGETRDIVELTDGRVLERYSLPQRIAGSAVGRVWNFRDLTARVQGEAERRRLETQIQHVQKLESLGVLAGGIAHDFNNLLVGILGHAGLAITDVEPETTIARRLRQIETAATRAAELTNQMLAYSGKGRFVVEPVNLSELVDEMQHLLQTVVSKHAHMDVSLDRDLPAIEGDPSQIRQVVMNLITNASDALGDGEGTITIRTRVAEVDHAFLDSAQPGGDAQEGTYICVEVRDTGCGMDDDTLHRIFDPFFTTKFTGRGLGLAAVLGIVRGHHGTMRIVSTPGAGTTFEVLFPIAHTAAAAPGTPPTGTVGSVPVRGRVLVVDDEEGVRDVSREVLERCGIDVVTAADGIEAVEIYRREGLTIDLVLLDMTMPRLDGREALREIRAIRSDACVLLTSGYSEAEAAHVIAGESGVGFIQKPYAPRALVQKVKEFLTAGA